MKYYEEYSDEELAVIRPVLRGALAEANGLQALAILLQSLRFFDTVRDEKEAALRNYAVWLLEQIGFLQAENLERLMRAWAEMPWRPVGETEDGD